MADLIRGSIAAATTTATPTYGQPVNGYGAKIPTRYMVRLADDPATGRLRRVYCAIYGNAGSVYVIRDGERVWLDDTELSAVLER